MNILRLSTLSLMTMILIPINGNANCDGIKHAGNHPHCSRAGGALSNEETLTQLAVSTGLSYEFLNEQTVAIQGAVEEVEDSNSGKSQPAASPILMAQNETPPKQPVPQDQAPSGAYAANEQKDSALEEIVVTATRRSVNVQAVPFSIRAISGKTLQDKGVERYLDWARLVPGLFTQDQGPGEKRFIIRGVQSVGPATVGVYFDDAVITNSNLEDDGGGRNAEIRLYDIERIEVLRGPQGTLYGANSFSGTIRIITNKPDPRLYSGSLLTNFSTTHSGDPTYKLNGHFNAPILEDKFAIRGVGWYENEGGFVDNIRLSRDDINDEETYGGRIAARLFANEKLTVTASALIQRTELNGKQRFFPTIGDLQTDEYIIDRYEDDVDLYQLSASYDAGYGTFEASTNLLNRDVLYRIDSTPFLLLFLPLPFALTINDQTDRRDIWSNEVRFVSDFNGPFQTVVGAFFQREEKDFTSNVFSASPEGLPLVSEPDVFGRVSAYEKDEYALFGELTYDVTERISVLAGLRFFDFDLKSQSSSTVPFGGLQGPAPPPDPNRASSQSDLSAKFGLSYKINEEALVYALASEGFRSGGTNSTGFGTLVIIPEEFESDSIWNYEIGAKTSWLDEHLIVNVSAYYIDWTNMQTIQQEPIQGFQYIGNAGAAAVTGFELELFALLAPGLDFTLAAGYQDARLTEDQPTLGGEFEFPVGKNGDAIPSIPEFTGAVSLQYTVPIGKDLEGVIRGDLAHVGSSFSQFNDDGLFQNKQDAYTIFDLRFSVRGARWEGVLYANNVFDERAEMTIVENRITPLSVFTNRPRTVGIALTVNF